MNILALLLAAATSTTAASQIHFRLYQSQIAPVIANLKANPAVRDGAFKNVHLHILVKNPPVDSGTIRPIYDSAVSIGISPIVGIRCMEISPSSGLGFMDPAIWIRNATNLRSVMAKFADKPEGMVFAFDVEDYAPNTPRAPSLEAQLTVMEPFLQAIKDTKIVPAVYPASLKEFPVVAIANAVNGNLEFWTENAFSYSELYRLDPVGSYSSAVDLARARTVFLSRWPNAVVRHGAYDHLLKNWGAPARESAMVDYGPWAPWIFDMIRVDNAKIGTPEWLSGASLSSTNDVSKVWVFAPYSLQASIPSIGGINLTPVQWITAPTGTRTDIRSSKGWIIQNNKILRAGDVFPRFGTNITVQDEFILPSNCQGPIFGANQPNYLSWQVVCDNDANRISLEVKQPAPVGKVSYTILDSPPRNTPIRIGISAMGASWAFASSVQTDALWSPAVGSTVTLPVATDAGGGHLHLGGGVSFETGGATVLNDLVTRRVELHLRAMQLPELLLALKGAYPRY